MNDSDDEHDKKRNSFLGLFTKKIKKSDDRSKNISEEVVRTMVYTSDFLNEEVSRYHDVRPLISSAEKTEVTYTHKNEKNLDKQNRAVESDHEDETKKETMFGLFQRKPKPVIEQPTVASEECVENMKSTCEFLNEEVNRYNDVFPVVLRELHTENEVSPNIFSQSVVELEVENKIVEDSKKSPLLSLFSKKSKKQEERPEPISEEVIKKMNDTSDFLNAEVNKYHDARPAVFSAVKYVEGNAITNTISESELLKTEKPEEASNLVESQIEEQKAVDLPFHSEIVAGDSTLHDIKLITKDSEKQIKSNINYEEGSERKPISNDNEGKSKGGLFNLFGKNPRNQKLSENFFRKK